MSKDNPLIEQVDAWLLGQLTEDEQLAFEEALTHDEALQLAVTLAEEALATIWLAETQPITPSASLFERLETSISPDSAGVMGFASTIARLLDTSLEHARTLLAQIADPEMWFPGPAPGTHLIHIDDVALAETAIVGFIKIEPGEHFPHHEHVGAEQTFVLSGTMQDGDKLYYRGQHYTADPHSDHLIGPHGDQDVIYLTIVDHGIKFGELFIGPGDPEV